MGIQNEKEYNVELDPNTKGFNGAEGIGDNYISCSRAVVMSKSVQLGNLTINQLLTPYNHNIGDISRIKYIVIHYVGATGGAKANCEYYAGGDRGASAHYYCGFDGEIWQSVEDKNIAWHCGHLPMFMLHAVIQTA